MRKSIFILFILFASKISLGQKTVPTLTVRAEHIDKIFGTTNDSIDYQKSVIYNLPNKSTLTIFEWHVSCRGIYYRKYDIKKNNNKYTLQTYKRVHRRNFPLPQDSFSVDHIFTKVKFPKFKKYALADTNVVNFAKFETLGKRDGFKPRKAGDSWGEFFFYYNNKEIAHFTNNTSEQIDECEEAAIPEKYWDEEE